LTLVGHIESQVTTDSLFAAGDHVVQTGRTRGTVRANGASFDIPEVHVWELRDEKVMRYQAYIDTRAMLDALGR
jgi:ketosteroid isomerase-like protein